MCIKYIERMYDIYVYYILYIYFIFLQLVCFKKIHSLKMCFLLKHGDFPMSC